MGRPPKVAAIKRLEGYRGHRDILDPLPAAGEPPPPPAWFTADQGERYRAIVAAMPPGVLAEADALALQRCSVAWSAFAKLAWRLNREGELVEARRGKRGRPRVVPNPLIRATLAAAKEAAAAGAELGLSPLARSRIGSPTTADADPLEALLGPTGRAWTDYVDIDGEVSDANPVA